MASENETLADIIAEMRERAETMQTHGTTHGVKLAVREFAERLEAAWTRECAKVEADALTIGGIVEAARTTEKFLAVGNSAAMREALLKCREIALQWQADEADGVAGTTDKPQARSAAEAVIDMEFEINAALSAPPRNCDNYDNKTDAEIGFVEETEEDDRNPLYWQLFANWLFAPATKKGERDA